MEIKKEVTDRFADFIFDFDYEQYMLVGGYGSGKSYQVGLKLILKCLQEKRKVLVVREVYSTIKESCYDLLLEILTDMDLLANMESRKDRKTKVQSRKAPLEFIFPNGSRIIFRGMDEPAKVKSINDVSIVWLEECSEIKYDAYKELLGRIRTPNISLHFILSCNPVGKDNWVYQHFFKRLDNEGNEDVILDDEKLYVKKTIIVNGVYYHHSTPDDNPFLPKEYLARLDDIQNYDYPLYRVARHGRFGANGTRVLPQFTVALNAKRFRNDVKAIPQQHHYYGFDFGFESSYNAVVSMAVDTKNKYLYIYDEIYVNHITDDKMVERKDMKDFKKKQESTENINYLVADNEDPKAISYYRQSGFKIRGCRNKFAGSRLSNTRKIKRFKKIICSPKCKNVIRELRDLTYKKDKQGRVIYDDFNIDPHTFSAIWYGLDTYIVADLKDRKINSKAG
jgi:phage terminase large subunit